MSDNPAVQRAADVMDARLIQLGADEADVMEMAEALAAAGLLADPTPALTLGARLVAAERQRHFNVEGWTAEHDREHSDGSLATAAVCYVGAAAPRLAGLRAWWPWHASWWKPSRDPIRNLVKAGSLIVAEIDRLTAATEEPS